MMHRNRQSSLAFFMLFFCALVTAQTQYGTIPNVPDFETAIPINEIPVDELATHYSYLPDGQVWTARKLENWNQFFATGETVEVKFYYQKNLSSKLINETQIPIYKSEQWNYKIQYLGFTYVVFQGRNCKVICKYWRHPNGLCQYQSFFCNPTTVNVDFEPDLNLVQTIPFHIEKQNADSAFISVKLEKNPTDWKLKFWSSEVEILNFVELDAYNSDHVSEFSNDTLVVSFSDIESIKSELDLQEQLISVLNIQQ